MRILTFALAAACIYLALRPRDAAASITPSDAGGDVGDWLPQVWPLPIVSEASDLLIGTFMNQQHMSGYGLGQLQSREGFSATPYSDHKGYSIGYGHLILPGENLSSVTREQAAQLLADDVAWAESAVRSSVLVPLTQNQFDSLVSFTYNVGAGAFKASTLLRKLNAGDYAGASGQFGRWINASGQPLAALVTRRDAERQQFEA